MNEFGIDIRTLETLLKGNDSQFSDDDDEVLNHLG